MYTEEAKQENEERMAGIYEALRSISVSLILVDERLTSIERLMAGLEPEYDIRRTRIRQAPITRGA